MVFTITAKKTTSVQAAIARLAGDPATTWVPAIGAEEDKGSEIAECDFSFAGRDLRMIVRRQPTKTGDQLSLDDLDGWRFYVIADRHRRDRVGVVRAIRLRSLRGHTSLRGLTPTACPRRPVIHGADPRGLRRQRDVRAVGRAD